MRSRAAGSSSGNGCTVVTAAAAVEDTGSPPPPGCVPDTGDGNDAASSAGGVGRSPSPSERTRSRAPTSSALEVPPVGAAGRVRRKRAAFGRQASDAASAGLDGQRGRAASPPCTHSTRAAAWPPAPFAASAVDGAGAGRKGGTTDGSPPPPPLPPLGAPPCPPLGASIRRTGGDVQRRWEVAGKEGRRKEGGGMQAPPHRRGGTPRRLEPSAGRCADRWRSRGARCCACWLHVFNGDAKARSVK